MNDKMEELITSLFDMIQDAKAMPLSAEKCVIERNAALDILDELSAQLPGELKQAQSIVQSREELISQARREAEGIIRNAREQAEQLVKQEAIYQEARRQCEEMVLQTQNRMNQIKQASAEYVSGSLTQAEEAIIKAVHELRETRQRFQTISGTSPAQPAQPTQTTPGQQSQPDYSGFLKEIG